MIKIGGKRYKLDIKKISEFVNYSDRNTSKEIEIIDNYDGAKVVNKTVRELTAPANAQIDNIKYDLIKSLIATIISYDNPEISDDEIPFGIEICLNTLLEEGFLIEI